VQKITCKVLKKEKLKKLKIPFLLAGSILLTITAVLGFILATFNNNDYRKSITLLVNNLTDYQIEIIEPFKCKISGTPTISAAQIKLLHPGISTPLEFKNLKLTIIPSAFLAGRLQMTISGQAKEPKTLKWLLPNELAAVDSINLNTELIVGLSALQLQGLEIEGTNPKGLFLKLNGKGLIEDFSAPQPFSELDLSIKVNAPESRMLQAYLPDNFPETGPVQGSLCLIAISPTTLAAKSINLTFGTKDHILLQTKGEIAVIPVAPGTINDGINFKVNLKAAKPGPLNLNFKISGNTQKINISELTGSFRQSTITANLESSFAGPRPQIKGKIIIPSLFPDDLLTLLPATQTEPETQKSNTEKLGKSKQTAPGPIFSRNPLPRNWLHSFDCDLSLNINSIADIQKGLKKLKLKVKIDNGILKVDPFTCVFDEGNARITLTINDRASIPAIEMESTIDDLNLTYILTYFDTSSPVAGKLTIHAKFSSQGISPHKMASNLSGNLGVALEEGVVPNHLLKLIAIDILGWSFSRTLMKNQYADINCCVLSFEIDQGVIEKQTFLLDSKNLTITGAGSIDLKNETCDLTILPKKKRKFWAIVTPVTIKGPLNNPKVIAIPVKKAALLYGGALFAPQFFLPAIGINYLWEMIYKDGGAENNPCLKYLTNSQNHNLSQKITPCLHRISRQKQNKKHPF